LFCKLQILRKYLSWKILKHSFVFPLKTLYPYLSISATDCVVIRTSGTHMCTHSHTRTDETLSSVYKKNTGFTLILGWNARIKGVIYLSATVDVNMRILIIQSKTPPNFSAHSKVHILILKCDVLPVILLVIIMILIKVLPSCRVYVTMDGTLIKLYILTFTFVTS
jgi:hypothetical protein